MTDELKSFSSNITRGTKPLRNNLRDLITIIPAKPISVVHHEINLNLDFQPKNDKIYVPKRRQRCKVKTVRDIRCEFENDLYSFLPAELDKQKSCLLKKITGGFFKDDRTIAFAKSLLKKDKMLRRSSWQMLMNINPCNFTHNTQYALYNGNKIQLVGSKGGSCEYVWNFDLGNNKISKQKKRLTKIQKKKGLLKNSLDVKIKPGPLTRKKDLDDSFQKYHVGDIDLVDLPTPRIVVYPKYGIALEPSITNFLNSLQDQSGLISQKWAEFAVSMIGEIKDGNPVQKPANTGFTFDLNYAYDQSRILMRRGHMVHKALPKIVNKEGDFVSTSKIDDSLVIPEVIDIVDKILNTVEISLKQDQMFILEENVDNCATIVPKNTNSHKEKQKKKYGELERLDVTVIRVSDNKSDQSQSVCQQEHCILGCVCASLDSQISIKNHCGRFDCMFTCKCDFSKYRAVDSLEGDCMGYIPSFLNFDRKASTQLAKEEQKFHQTVIVTGERSIVLRPKRRDWKASKKYGDFYEKMCLKSKQETKKTIAINLIRLNCDNIKPWCMVHNLYNCFCKGRYTHEFGSHGCNNIVEENKPGNYDNLPLQLNDDNSINYKGRLRYDRKKSQENPDNYMQHMLKTSSRVRPYLGRKYDDKYYTQANEKILLLEKDDKTIQKRLQYFIDKDSDQQKIDHCIDFDNLDKTDDCNLVVSECSNEQNYKIDGNPIELDNDINELLLASPRETNDLRTLLLNVAQSSQQGSKKDKLIRWLESSYQGYRQRLEMGGGKICLVPPNQGKVVLYPWDFIHCRYKERKNLFLVSKQKPFRIYMAVDINNAFFKGCINIDDIRFADLQKYPVTVRSLLTNATDMENNFCILCGLSYCWELIGSVTKINEIRKDKTIIDTSEITTAHNENRPSCQESVCDIVGLAAEEINVEENIIDPALCSTKQKNDSSKWFFMTLENDFDEVQFQDKGFFVKHQNIIKAIHVARSSGKTVRLSSQKCLENKEDPPFGIYATPNVKELCVFVGPYEEDESLGLNTVRSTLGGTNNKRTKGIWIRTNKIDDLKVIDNPISFIPKGNVSSDDLVFIEPEKTTAFIGESNLKRTLPESQSPPLVETETKTYLDTPKTIMKSSTIKIVKPIKIKKRNGLYHLAPVATKQSTLKPTNNSLSPKTDNFPEIKKLILKQKNNMTKVRPVAEIAPQVKADTIVTKATKKGMFILKPDEINRKLFNSQQSYKNEDNNKKSDNEMEKDIENFLETSKECSVPSVTVLISDDEGDKHDPSQQVTYIDKEVFIVCKNITNIGWIQAKKNNNNFLSFKFPGFKYTNFYPEEKALNMINQAFERKIYIPKHISLNWTVEESDTELKSRCKLKLTDFGPDVIMTKNGIQRKPFLATLSEPSLQEDVSMDDKSLINKKEADTLNSTVMDNEEEYRALEDEGNRLWNATLSNKSSILASLTKIPDDLRDNMTETLKGLMTDINETVT